VKAANDNAIAPDLLSLRGEKRRSNLCGTMDCFASLSSGVHSRDPLARNDGDDRQSILNLL
jgi:hypothetical protein